MSNEIEKSLCNLCDKLSNNLTKVYQNKNVCQDCLDDKYACCDYCNEYMPEASNNVVSDENVCQNCLDDSESLAIELARTIEGKQELSEAQGSIAFVAVQEDKATGKLSGICYGRNGLSPLMLDNQKDYLAISSEGGGVSVKANILYTIKNPLDVLPKTEEKAMTLGAYEIKDDYRNYRYVYPEDDKDDNEEELEWLKQEKKNLEKQLRDNMSLADNDEIELKNRLDEINADIRELRLWGYGG